MAVFLQTGDNTSFTFPYPYSYLAMAQGKGSTQQESEDSSDSSSIKIKTENENWRGKNDPTERRRIQNRLNQRAFRQRRRTGQSPPQSRGTPTSSPDRSQDERSHTVTARQSPESTAAALARLSSSPPETQTASPWDELARTINGNLMEAVTTNARSLQFDRTVVMRGDWLKTPILQSTVPETLAPVPLQHQLPHDLIYDTIPHPRLRQNIMSAIASGRLDQKALSNCIRASGSIDWRHGTLQRRGLVVWGDAGSIHSWELTEGFVRAFGFLLDGCEDFLAATNTWRAMRGEAPLVL